MIYKREFDEERNECEEVYHIEDDITDPTLIEIDRLYGQADALSINMPKYIIKKFETYPLLLH